MGHDTVEPWGEIHLDRIGSCPDGFSQVLAGETLKQIRVDKQVPENPVGCFLCSDDCYFHLRIPRRQRPAPAKSEARSSGPSKQIIQPHRGAGIGQATRIFPP